MKLKKTCIMTLAALSGILILTLGTCITTFAKEDAQEKQVMTMAATANLNLRDSAGLHGKVLYTMEM